MLPSSGLPWRMHCPAGEGVCGRVLHRLCLGESAGGRGFLRSLGSARRDLSTPSSVSVLSPSSSVVALLPGPSGG